MRPGKTASGAGPTLDPSKSAKSLCVELQQVGWHALSLRRAWQDGWYAATPFEDSGRATQVAVLLPAQARSFSSLLKAERGAWVPRYSHQGAHARRLPQLQPEGASSCFERPG